MWVLLIICIAILVGFFILLDRTLSRTAQPGGAPRLSGPGTYSFEIVGESYYQDALSRLCGGKTEEGAEHYTTATLRLENENPYDDKAVAVEIEGLKVGHLSRHDARKYRKAIKRFGSGHETFVCDAVIAGGWRRSDDDEGHFGVRLDIPPP